MILSVVATTVAVGRAIRLVLWVVRWISEQAGVLVRALVLRVVLDGPGRDPRKLASGRDGIACETVP